MQRRVGLAAFVMGAVLATAGCTSGSAGPNLSSATTSGSSLVVTTSATPTVSPKPTSPYPADVPLTGHNVRPGEKPPLYPDAAKVKSQAGANAFAEFFMRTLDWAYATTNSSYMKHYIGSTCGLCSGLATGIAKTASDKHWYLGGRITIRSIAPTAIAPVLAPAAYCSIVVIDVSATSVTDSTNKIFSGDGAYQADQFKLCFQYVSPKPWNVSYLARLS